jgi:hypothetical protein
LDSLRYELENQKAEEISKRDRDVQDLKDAFSEVRSQVSGMQEESARGKRESANRLKTMKKAAITAIMLNGLLLSLALLSLYNTSMLWVLFIAGSMAFGAVLYHWISSPWPSLIVYGLAMAAVAGVILIETQSETLLWLIPIGFDVLVVGGERFLAWQAGTRE